MKTDSFALRHIGPNSEDQEKMLKTIGLDSMDQLIFETIPDDIRLQNTLDLPKAMSESEFMTHIQALADKNKIYKTY